MIIGIVGKARSGKDTFSKMLVEELNATAYPPYIMMAFAHELKKRCQEDFDLTYDQLWGDEKEAPDMRYVRSNTVVDLQPVTTYWTGREIMQQVGQFYRTIDYNYWVNLLYRVIEDKNYKNVVITDVRHINEADSVKEHGGILIRVTRDNAPKIHGEQHISETALDDYVGFDYEVINNYGLKELNDAAKDVVGFLKRTDKIIKEIDQNG